VKRISLLLKTILVFTFIFITLNSTQAVTLTAVGNYSDDAALPYSFYQANHIQRDGEILYTISSNLDSVNAYNISDVTDIQPLGEYANSVAPYSTDGVLDFDISGDYLYAASQTDHSITILNISDPTNITAVGEYLESATAPLNSSYNAQRISVAGSRGLAFVYANTIWNF
jgi:hypothetical protein